jgi:predicted transglutaminase-like cysteine proteinase
MLTEILILLFIIIIFYEIFNDFCNSKQYEGFDTSSNDPMVLSQKNAGQILLLKDQYNSQTKSINDIKDYITKLFDNVETLNGQVKALKSNK